MPEPFQTQSGEAPICLGINICNEIIIDARTNNKSLISCFNGIVAQQLPATHHRMFIMASVTNVFQNTDILISMRDPEYREMIPFHAQITASDPLAVHDLIVEVHNLQLALPGTYFVDVIYKEMLLAERRFLVQIVAPQSQPPRGFPSGNTPA
jgi:hypothetical protein